EDLDVVGFETTQRKHSRSESHGDGFMAGHAVRHHADSLAGREADLDQANDQIAIRRDARGEHAHHGRLDAARQRGEALGSVESRKRFLGTYQKSRKGPGGGWNVVHRQLSKRAWFSFIIVESALGTPLPCQICGLDARAGNLNGRSSETRSARMSRIAIWVELRVPDPHDQVARR